jgi:Holliday junction resolvase RusA-like endonuclease
MSEIRLTIPGKPTPLSRTGHGQFGAKFLTAPTSRQIGLVVDAWEKAGSHRFGDDEPLELIATFFYERPRSHFGTGRNAGELKNRYRSARPFAGGDTDNLVKLVLDALQHNAFRNDSRVVEVFAGKFYAAQARSEIVVRAL